MSDLIDRISDWDMGLALEVKAKIERLEERWDAAQGIIESQAAEIERLKAVVDAAKKHQRYHCTQSRDELAEALAALEGGDE